MLGFSQPSVIDCCGIAAGSEHPWMGMEMGLELGAAQPGDLPQQGKRLPCHLQQELFPSFPLICLISSELPVACIPKHVTFYFHF